MLEDAVQCVSIFSAEELDSVLAETERKKCPCVYLTDIPRIVEILKGKNLPCIYMERPGAPRIYGADLVWLAEQAEGDALSSRPQWPIPEEELLKKVWQRHYHLPWRIADTGRLIIRETVPQDLPELLRIYNQEKGSPDVQSFSEKPEEELRAYIENFYRLFGYGLWTVMEKRSHRVIGRAGLENLQAGDWQNREIYCFAAADKYAGAMPEEGDLHMAYLLDERYRGQGLGTEAARAVLSYAVRDLAADRIYLLTSPSNIASARIADRLGFRKIKRNS